MTATRVALIAGIALLTAFVIVVASPDHAGAGGAGRRSCHRGAGRLPATSSTAATRTAPPPARVRPAQEAHDRAADLAAEARRAAAEAGPAR